MGSFKSDQDLWQPFIERHKADFLPKTWRRGHALELTHRGYLVRIDIHPDRRVKMDWEVQMRSTIRVAVMCRSGFRCKVHRANGASAMSRMQSKEIVELGDPALDPKLWLEANDVEMLRELLTPQILERMFVSGTTGFSLGALGSDVEGLSVLHAAWPYEQFDPEEMEAQLRLFFAVLERLEELELINPSGPEMDWL